ncbi:hypothetical protein VNI00_018610 [Paramarasmius palmivorus]|uniref:Uncharacterized protein n=1 Tax=Paramarasmius palmivorus TaxID=297713 RepID=A0AAW0AWH3_9AGAR
MSTNDNSQASSDRDSDLDSSNNISRDVIDKLLEEFQNDVKRVESLPRDQQEFYDVLVRLAASLRTFASNGYAAQRLMSSEMLDVVYDLKRVTKLQETLQNQVELLECEGIHIMEKAARVNKWNEELNHQVQDLRTQVQEVLEDRMVIEQELYDLQEQGARELIRAQHTYITSKKVEGLRARQGSM